MYKFAFLIILGLLFTGCQTESTPEQETHHHSDSYKPKDFSKAVARLSELHVEILSEDLEVRTVGKDHAHEHNHHHHGDEDHSHHHDHAKPVKIDAITEMSDIVTWVPQLAADTDIDESEWESIKQVSEKMNTLLKPIQAEELSDRKEKYLSVEDQIKSELEYLSELSEQQTGTKET